MVTKMQYYTITLKKDEYDFVTTSLKKDSRQKAHFLNKNELDELMYQGIITTQELSLLAKQDVVLLAIHQN